MRQVIVSREKPYRVIAEQIPRIGDEIFILRHFSDADFDYPVHHHNEFELNYVYNCSGSRIIGDNISDFTDSDMVFLGKNLSHKWQKEIYETRKSKVITLQFGEEIFSEYLLNTSLFCDMKLLLNKSKRGIEITGAIKKRVEKILFILINQKGFKAFNSFMNILELLSDNHEKLPCIATEGYSIESDESKSLRINKVYRYTLNNYAEVIKQNEVASIIGMTESAFSHFFKKHTNQNYTQFLINLRLGKASKFLIETKYNISEICYMTGFRNISNFNRRFKERFGSTPSDYRKKIRESRGESGTFRHPGFQNH